MRVNREDLGPQTLVGHLDQLCERFLLAAIELHLRVASEAAEVPLALDERVPRREILRETDEGVVDRDIAVRVVLRHHDANDVR